MRGGILCHGLEGDTLAQSQARPPVPVPVPVPVQALLMATFPPGGLEPPLGMIQQMIASRTVLIQLEVQAFPYPQQTQ